MNVCVIPDCHASPDTSNRRFEWLGNLLLERQPDLIINLGDLFDMNSLSSYDRGKKSFEGRRYQSDINSGIDALTKIHKPFNDFNNRRSNIKKAKLKEPRKIITLGNHEFRINRAIENSPELDGLMSLDNLRLKDFGYEIYPFRQVVEVNGVYFCHFYPSGTKGESISGFNIASNLIAKNLVSSICGHSHLWDMAIRARPDGTKAIGLCAGWYGEEATYSDATEQLWHSCITILHEMANGSFDCEQLGIERVKKLYG